MKRRSFILLSGLGISAIGISSVRLFNLDFEDQNLYAKPKLLSKLCNDETIRLLGESYLKFDPDERNRDRLMNKLYGHAIRIDSLQQQDRLSMRAQVENSIREDFAAGKTVVLKGWVLSVTEARQCALYSILNS
jgi:hypothetical protein